MALLKAPDANGSKVIDTPNEKLYTPHDVHRWFNSSRSTPRVLRQRFRKKGKWTHGWTRWLTQGRL